MKVIRRIANWYFSKQARPYWFVLLFDSIMVLLSGLMCYVLVHGGIFTARHFLPWMGTWTCYLLIFMLCFHLMKTYAGVLRYSSFSDLYRVVGANFLAVSIIAAMRWFLQIDRYLVTVRMRELVIIFMMATIIMCGVRILMKYMFEKVREEQAQIRVFIYGVKSGGIALAKSIRSAQPVRFHLTGFVSDADDMIGHTLQGVQVYPNDEYIVDHMKQRGATALLVSPLKTDRLTKNQDMVNSLLEAGVRIYVYDQAQEWDGKSEIGHKNLREVEIEELLPRSEIRVDLKSVKEQLTGKNVLITGSAGSIGKEIVRQVAAFKPSKMILIDQAETPQHDVLLMMAKDFPEVDCEVIVTSIDRQSRMEAVFDEYKPDYVFHAAAYKHVPMMENNPSEAVMNNVKGTKIIADLSVKYGVKKFVMISTDKAVNPTNVMGCSKRICEIYVQSLAKKLAKEAQKNGTSSTDYTQFVTTRFGNVLGSNGSVIPLFKQQIKNGGPVTVTDERIVRFFMLIPEACKLVLEAGTMGNGGEIFVFDMGEPVKIADLAKRMIALSGAKNIEIKYTGLREGEKLYEEVLNELEGTKPTFHEKIRIAQVREYDFDEVSREIDDLVETAKTFDKMDTVRKMKQIVPEYKSNNSVYEVLDG